MPFFLPKAVSTLRRAVRGLGGDLEVTAVIGNKRIKLSVQEWQPRQRRRD